MGLSISSEIHCCWVDGWNEIKYLITWGELNRKVYALFFVSQINGWMGDDEFFRNLGFWKSVPERQKPQTWRINAIPLRSNFIPLWYRFLNNNALKWNTISMTIVTKCNFIQTRFWNKGLRIIILLNPVLL